MFRFSFWLLTHSGYPNVHPAHELLAVDPDVHGHRVTPQHALERGDALLDRRPIGLRDQVGVLVEIDDRVVMRGRHSTDGVRPDLLGVGAGRPQVIDELARIRAGRRQRAEAHRPQRARQVHLQPLLAVGDLRDPGQPAGVHVEGEPREPLRDRQRVTGDRLAGRHLAGAIGTVHHTRERGRDLSGRRADGHVGRDLVALDLARHVGGTGHRVNGLLDRIGCAAAADHDSCHGRECRHRRPHTCAPHAPESTRSPHA